MYEEYGDHPEKIKHKIRSATALNIIFHKKKMLFSKYLFDFLKHIP